MEYSDYPDNEPVTYSQPKFNVTEKEKFDKDGEWFKKSLRYYSTFYNRNTSVWSSDNPGEDMPPVDKGILYSLYMSGKQRNIDYNHITQDPSGNTLQAVWIKGNKVKVLMDNLRGNMIDQLGAKELAAKALSKEAASRRTRMFDDLMLKHDEQAMDVFDTLAKIGGEDGGGIEFNPAGRRQFDTKEQIERFIERDWKDNGEIFATDLAKAIEKESDANMMYLKCFEEFCAFNYCGVMNYVENGRVKERKIPAYNLIWDRSIDDPLSRNSRFGGYVDRLTIEEIQAKWPSQVDGPIIDDLRRIAKDNLYQQQTFLRYNSSSFDWWQTNDYGTEKLLINAVSMWWIGPRDLQYRQTTDKYGNDHIKKDADSYQESRSKFITEDIHYGILLGNKYLIEYGYDKNVVRDYNNRTTPELPIKIFTGDVILTEGVSPIGVVAQNQDAMDAYKYKIQLAAGRANGKNVVIYGNKLGNVVNAKELIQDFKSMGVTVMEGPTGEDGDNTNGQKLLDVIDMSMTSDVQSFMELYREEERIMEESLSIPKVALGQQQTYTGLNTQKNTMKAASTGLAQIFNLFTQFNEMCLQHAVNLGKMVYMKEGSFDGEMIIGDRGMKYFNITEGYTWQDMLIFLTTKDVVDQAMRERLLSYAQAWSQNPDWGISPVDILRLEKGKSLTQIIDDLEFSLKNSKLEKQKMMAAQAEAEQAAEQQKHKNDLEKIAIKDQGATTRVEKAGEVKLHNTIIKSDADLEKHNTIPPAENLNQEKETNLLADMPIKK